MSILNQLISRRKFLRDTAIVSSGLIGLLSGYKNIYSSSYSVKSTNRVIWLHDSDATSWNGSGYYGAYVNQERINAMMGRGIKALTGDEDLLLAWQKIIPNYTSGKKIGIKVNINNSSTDNAIDAHAAPIIALISSLKSAGVAEGDIYIMEPSREFSTRIASPVLLLFPDVLFWDSEGTYGNQVTFNDSSTASTTIKHSNPGLIGEDQYSYIPEQMEAISYLISMPILKGHSVAEISLTFKNNFGILKKWTVGKLHDFSLPARSQYSYDMNPLHDIYLNTNIKDKLVLIVGDGLFGSRIDTEGVPEVWNSFSDEFPNSIFLGTDPVAVDSVMFDFLNAESERSEQAQLYLHRATELGLGIHEHWDSNTSKAYSLIDFVKIDMNNISNRSESSFTPDQYILFQNYPNPFNNRTKIEFKIADTADVILEVFDGLGAKITTLVDKRLSAGLYTVHLDAGNMSSGIYYYKIQAGTFTDVKRMQLIK